MEIKFWNDGPTGKLKDFLLEDFGGEDIWGNLVKEIESELGTSSDNIILTTSDESPEFLEFIRDLIQTNTDEKDSQLVLFELLNCISILYICTEGIESIYIKESDKEKLENLIVRNNG